MSHDLMTQCALDVRQSTEIDAPIDIAFDALLEQLGPANTHPDGYNMKLVLEPTPGGRWFRDLGDNNGHLWGHVQVIKRPTLLEICGPLFMSYPALSHVQFRLVEAGGRTTLTVQHRAIGPVEAAHREGVGRGWKGMLEHAKAIAIKRAAS